MRTRDGMRFQSCWNGGYKHDETTEIVVWMFVLVFAVWLGIRRIDVLVVDGRGSPEVVGVLRHRWRVGRVVDGATTTPVRLQVGRLVVTVAPPAAIEVQVLPP
ncbi:hypothetical protein ACE2AJ_18760 [Aquihabitans daechungensis]|uniref:hypothetical protein n=1 Tax=Aquihabitans daechungensis TaxID=1052257 RepID=UPI003BA0BFF7